MLAAAVEEFSQVVMEDDSINPFDVIKNFCSYEGNISFNINESDAEQDMIELIAAMVVGDGDEKKGSRTAIFHPLFREFACSVRKTGNRNIVYTVFGQNISEPQAKKSPTPKQTSSSNPRSFESEPSQGDMPALSDKYKAVEEANTREVWVQRGKELIAELNKIRKEPKQYVHALKAELSKFKDDKTIEAGYGTITTKEGQAPYYDLISELESQYPLPTIREVTGLTIVAVEQLVEAESMI